MEQFNIDIAKDGQWKTINVYMDPGRDVMVVAEALSKQFPDARVSVTMFARIRRAYVNGEVVASEPDLDKFYKDNSDQDKHSWSCYGQVTD